jgi:short-subunit dehydrogenase
MPFNGAYSASKFAVEGLSDSLRRELLIHGIDVVLIEPGPVKTAIWAKAEQVDVSVYENTVYFAAVKNMLAYMLKATAHAVPAERLGQLILTALTTPKPRVRYVITPNILEHYIVRYLPTRMVDRMVGKMLGLLQAK